MKVEESDEQFERRVKLTWMTRLLRTSFAHLSKTGPPENEWSCGPGCVWVGDDNCPNMNLTLEDVREELSR